MLLRIQAARSEAPCAGGSAAIRFCPSTSLAFPPGEIETVAVSEVADEPPRMTVAMLGLTGTQGVLPLWYTEFLRERVLKHDEALNDFLGMFHHKLTWLYYRAWEKHRVFVPFERKPYDDPFSKCLLAFIGMRTGSGADSSGGRVFLRYAGLLSQRPLSAPVLALILSDYLGEQVQVEQFHGRWCRLSDDHRLRLEPGHCDQLGVNTLVGEEAWDRQAAFRIVVGPLSRDRFLQFIPGSPGFMDLCAFAETVMSRPLEFEIKLILKAAEVPAWRLTDDPDAFRLGVLSWLKVDEFVNDARDAVFEAR